MNSSDTFIRSDLNIKDQTKSHQEFNKKLNNLVLNNKSGSKLQLITQK